MTDLATKPDPTAIKERQCATWASLGSASNQDQTAGELVRVTRRGGRIGLASHTPEGFADQLSTTGARHETVVVLR